MHYSQISAYDISDQNTPCPKQKEKNIIFNSSAQQNWERSIQWSLSYKFYGFYSLRKEKQYASQLNGLIIQAAL